MAYQLTASASRVEESIAGKAQASSKELELEKAIGH